MAVIGFPRENLERKWAHIAGGDFGEDIMKSFQQQLSVKNVYEASFLGR